MIEVKYRGRLGNNLFQYCFGRIIAETLGYKLKADPIPGFPATYETIEGKDFSHCTEQVLKGHFYDLESVLRDQAERKIIAHGHFQRYEFYKKFKGQIKNIWLKKDFNCSLRISENDIVLCVRRTDYIKHNQTLPYSFFKDVLQMAEYDDVYIVTDDPKDPFVLKLKKEFNATIAPDNVFDNFAFIMSANKIVLSQSTFSWFAAFLSDAKEIYFPLPKNGLWSEDFSGVDLQVDDEDRYIYVQCKEEVESWFTQWIPGVVSKWAKRMSV